MWIVGYGFTGEPIKGFLLSARCPVNRRPVGYTDSLVVDIVRLEPNPTSGGSDAISVSDGRCATMTPDEPICYNFLHLSPGLYAMTGLVPLSRISFVQDKIKYRLPFTDMRRFRVNAGDVVYLGDVVAHYDSTQRSSAIPDGLPNRTEIRRSDEAAKAELARRNGPIDKFRYVPFTSQ